MIRAGILGAAKIAPRAFIDPAKDRGGVALAAVASRDRQRGETFAAEHGIASVETSYEALIARGDIDLIYNALPPNRHADLSIAALEAGKAVLCEKPFAMNAVEAARMTEAAARTGRPLLEAFHYRFHPAFSRLMALLASGRIGSVQRMEAVFNAAIPYRAGELRHEAALGGGALMDLGCYPLHWVRTLTGEEPEIVSAEAVQTRPGVDTQMKAELAFPSGVTAAVSTSMADGEAVRAFVSIKGDKGALYMANPLAPHQGHRIDLTLDGETTSETVDGDTTYHHQLDHMLDVLNGAAPLTGGADALAQMRAIDAIYRAAGMTPRGM